MLNLDAVLSAIMRLKELTDLPIRMNNDGQAPLLYPTRDVASELAEAGLDRIRISLNAPDPDTYIRLC